MTATIFSGYYIDRDKMNPSSITVFADGACSGNPGPGGWGVIIVISYAEEKSTHVIELGGASPETTNNKMELTAAGKALRYLEKTPGKIFLYTDSKYVIQGITQWVIDWQKNDWKKSDGKPVANSLYWKRLLELINARQKELGPSSHIQWNFIKGHSGVPANERCDEIAVQFSKGKKIKLYQGPLNAYPIDIKTS